MQKISCKDIPNILSVFRLILVAVFIATFFLFSHNGSSRIALCVFVLAGVTDIIDGYLARRNNWVSDLGKILDPLADKLMQCSVLVCLTLTNMVELWFVLPYILKELLMMFGGLFIMKSKRIFVVSNVFGKFAALVFYVAIGLILLLSSPWQIMVPMWTTVICTVSLFCTVLALVIYIFQYFLSGIETRTDVNQTK